MSDGLGADNVRALKNLCYDFIPKPQLEAIDIGLEIFNALIEKGKFTFYTALHLCVKSIHMSLEGLVSK